MAHPSESGNGWEVVRQFVPKDLAEVSGRQVLLLADLRKPYVEIRNFQSDRKDLTTYLIGCGDPEDLLDGMSNLLDDNDIPEGMNELIEVARLAHEQVENCMPGFRDLVVVNRYDLKGYLGWHQDNQPYDSFALALMGLREYWVEDITTREAHRLELKAGDALRLYNPPDITKRPGHRLRNIDTGVSLTLLR